MNGDWAAENLQTIRTLMERAALYRRALAPIMITVGCIGLAAAVLGWKLEIAHPSHFLFFWLAVAVIACGTAFVLVRRQAVIAREPVWTPPARRVVLAALPALTAGLLLGLDTLVDTHAKSKGLAGAEKVLALAYQPQLWLILYGCALHSAGYFLQRSIRLFGWAFIVGGCWLFFASHLALPPVWYGHGVMGFFFGLLHQAYGVYLYLTEKKDSAA